MAQDDEKRPQSESKKDLYFLLVILFAVGLLLVGGAAFWKQVSSESNDKLLILQIGQRMAGSGADTADGSVAQPTKPLANLITELVTGSNQQNGWVADLSRDLGIALLISVIATFLIEKYASDRLREDIARDVLSAAYLKVVPKEIFAQVADNVFRSEVYRTDWEVHINASAHSLTGLRACNHYRQVFLRIEEFEGTGNIG